jgi:hypothetical protein
VRVDVLPPEHLWRQRRCGRCTECLG